MNQTPMKNCTSLQKAYYFGRSKYSELFISSQYYYEIEVPALDIEKFASALQTLFYRHEMLRAAFTSSGEQYIDPAKVFVPPTIHDFTSESENLDAKLLEIRKQASNFDENAPRRGSVEVHVSKLPKNMYRIHFNHDLCVFDIGSVDIYTRELDALYHDPKCELPKIGYSYLSYIDELFKQMTGVEGRAAEEYWLPKIANLPKGPEFPLVRKGPYHEKSQLHKHIRNVDAQTWQKILKISKSLEVSPTVIFCYAFMKTLSMWSKTPHFTIAMLINDRGALGDKVAHTIGQFAKSILLTFDFRTQLSISDSLKSLKEQFRMALKNCAFDGVRIIQEMNRRDHSVGQVPVPVVFVSNLTHFEARKEGLQKSKIFSINSDTYIYNKLETPSVYFDFQTYTLSDGTVNVAWDIVDSLFPEGMIHDMQDSFLKILGFFAEGNIEEIKDSSHFMPTQQVETLRTVHNSEKQFEHQNIQKLFENSAQKWPDKCAIVSSDKKYSYREVEIYSTNLAKHLSSHGARPGQLIGLCLPKGAAQIVGALGILQSGAAYMPLQPQFPQNRIDLLIQRGDAKLVVTSKKLQSISFADDVQVVFIEDFMQPHLQKVHVPVVQNKNDVAYVIFTSGSTGEPKGVAIDHEGCVNTLLDINDRFGITANDTVFAISAITFDLSVYDIFGIFAAGATMVIPTDDEASNPQEWARLIAKEKVTLWNSAPAVMQMLITYAEHTRDSSLSNLRTAMLSGDWIPVDLPNRIQAFSPSCEVISLGGATEASIWSIYYRTKKTDQHANSIPYGKPLANQRVYVLDDAFYEKPTFVPGKIFLAGKGLAMNYWRSPERTNAQFIHHPRTGERLYLTGDLGRYLPDGNIEFLGREDHQVKINGYRIELSEIEAVLEKNSDVDKAIVVVSGKNPKQSSQYLVAFFKRKELNSNRKEMDLKPFLERYLPSYMIPKFYIELKEWPYNSSGKIDRKALPLDRIFNEDSTEKKHQDRLSPTETRVQKIFSEVLARSTVGVDEDFYQLGGDSLAAVNVLTKLEQTFRLELPISIITGALSVSRVANEIENLSHKAWTPLVPLSKKPNHNPLFLVHPSGGNILCYQEIATQLDGSAFGLQASGLQPGTKPLDSVEAMAALYVSHIRQVQAHGPYLVGGWSFGGMVALEMSRILKEQYNESSNVLMVDFIPPRSDSNLVEEQYWLGLLRDLSKRTQPIQLEQIKSKSPSECLNVASQYLSDVLGIHLSKDRLQSLFNVYKGNITAYRNYQPKQYTAGIYKIQATESLTQIQLAQDEDISQRKWMSWLETIPVSLGTIEGTHYSILEKPESAKLVTLMNSFIAISAGFQNTHKAS